MLFEARMLRYRIVLPCRTIRARQFRQCERVALDAIVHLGCLLEMHTAQTTTERAAFIDFEIRPFPDAQIIQDRVAVVTGDMESIGVLVDEPTLSGAGRERQEVAELDMKPLATNSARPETPV